MSQTEISPITEQDIEDAAYLFLMSVNAYIGFEKTGLELAGASHIILSAAVQQLNNQHEQTTRISESTSGAGTSIGTGEIQDPGTQGRLTQGSEGDGQDFEAETSGDDTAKSEVKSQKRPSVRRKNDGNRDAKPL